jgi:cytochrome c-type biogenesis protein CcmH/NrfG
MTGDRMENEEKIREEVEKTLRAFDDERILEPNPFLYARIKAEQESRSRRSSNGIPARISLNFVVVMIVFLVNLFTALYYFEGKKEQDLQEKLVSELKEDLQIDQSQNLF